jgi:hypothetical protein
MKEQRRLLERQGRLLESLIRQVAAENTGEPDRANARQRRVLDGGGEDWGAASDADNNYTEDVYAARGTYRRERSTSSGLRPRRLLRGLKAFAGVVTKSAVDVLGFWVGLGFEDDEDDDDGGDNTAKGTWTPAAIVAPQALPLDRERDRDSGRDGGVSGGSSGSSSSSSRRDEHLNLNS